MIRSRVLAPNKIRVRWRNVESEIHQFSCHSLTCRIHLLTNVGQPIATTHRGGCSGDGQSVAAVVVHVVAINQHGDEAGDGAAIAASQTFQRLRHQRHH